MRRRTLLVGLIFTLVLVLNLSVTVVAAKPKLQFWGNRLFITDFNDLIEKMVQDFAEEYDVEVEVTMVGGPDWPTKLSTAVAVGAVPDVLFPGATLGLLYQEDGVWMELPDLYDEIGASLGGYFDSAKRFSGLNGEKYAVPFFNFVTQFYFRKDILDSKGLNVPTTWDEFTPTLEKAQDPRERVWGFAYPIVRYGDTTGVFQSLMWSHGASITNEGGTEVTLNSPEMVKVVQMVKDWYHKHKILPPGVGGWDGGSNNRAYLTRQAVSAYDPPSELFVMRTEDPELLADTVMQETLIGPAGQFGAPANMMSFFISANTEYPELAKKLVRYFYEGGRYEQIFNASGGLGAPVVIDGLSYPIFSQDDFNRVIVKQASLAQAPGYPGPITKAALRVNSEYVLNDMLIDAVINEMDTEKAVEKAHSRAVKIFDEER